jgi:nucleotide-binding universal stress UspA family protein
MSAGRREVFRMRILLAVDGSTFSNAAVREVTRRPWPTGSEVKIISVVEPAIPPSPEVWGMSAGDYIEEQTEWRRSHARKTLAAAERLLHTNEDKTLKVTTEILTGPPRQVILDESDQWGADLIVIGSHGYGFWNRLLLGSVSQAVASYARCSVEIVKRLEVEKAEKK